MSDSAGAKDSGEMISLWTLIWSNIFSLFFFLSLAKAAAFASKRKEVGNTARVDSTMLYSHFIRHYNTFMIMLLNM